LTDISSLLNKLMHFDTDMEGRSLNEEFFRVFGEKPAMINMHNFN